MVKRVLLVSVEPPWPAHHGGRIRTAKVAEALGRGHDVLVAYPQHGEQAQDTPVAVSPLAWSATASVRTRISGRPHLGGYFLASMAKPLSALATHFQPDVIMWSHSYLAAWSPAAFDAVPQVVEFANIEANRLSSLVKSGSRKQKLARYAEAAKARHWEPRVARAAEICVALSEPDLRLLQAWKANALLVPNGVDRLPYEPSPVDGYALALASYDYEPNVTAARHLVRHVWPAVAERVPGARLVIAGRRSELLKAEFESVPGVTVAGTLDEVSWIYAGAAVSVAAATSGGGSQLKLTEALARGRSVVMSPFAAEGMPPALRGHACYQVAASPEAFAAAIGDSLGDCAARHAREQAAVDLGNQITWERMVSGLSEAIDNLESRSLRR